MAAIAHEVTAGECLSTIAAKYGLPWKAVWEAPENAALRRKRKDPNVLFVGDVVHVPSPKEKRAEVSPGKSHKFVLRREKVKVYLKLTAGLEPLAGEPFRIEYGDREIEGSTQSDGTLEADVEATQEKLVLTLPRRQQTYTLALGALDPLATVRGAQIRLQNLGLYGGELSGELDFDTTRAIELFQRIKKLPVTGKYDAGTQKALGLFHGC